jgi:hypothetical protein
MAGEGLQQVDHILGPGPDTRAEQRPDGNVQLLQQQEATASSPNVVGVVCRPALQRLGNPAPGHLNEMVQSGNEGSRQ